MLLNKKTFADKYKDNTINTAEHEYTKYIKNMLMIKSMKFLL